MAETPDAERSGAETTEEAAPKKLTPLEAVKQRQAALAQSRASGTKRGSASTEASSPGAASSHRPAVQLQRKAGDS
ncbi:MAG: hypothetical protein JWN98_657 [Abditibacteriota bacterium]|jgi:hypothetical protein|nr:hypothetical protein [Abditibacteriota bacterium]